MGIRPTAFALSGGAIALFASPAYLYRDVHCEMCVFSDGHLMLLVVVGLLLGIAAYSYARIAQPMTTGAAMLAAGLVSALAGVAGADVGFASGVVAVVVDLYGLTRLAFET